MENNRYLKLPKDIDEKAKLEEIEEDVYLPDVVKDFIKTASETKKKECARTVIEPLCCELPEVVQRSNNSLSNVAKYFSENSRLNIEPYILSQKKRKGSYESTTKCIINLRYGTVYQMSVNYFTEEELQQQLFELVTLNGEDSSSLINETNENIKKRAQECLKVRFEILTDHGFFSNSQEIKCPKDIVLSKEVQQLAGKTELYIGNGKEVQHDRLAMQSILRQLTTNQRKKEDTVKDSRKKIAAVKQIVIYLPSKILYGGKEILEMPGTDDSDPMAMNFIETALNEVDAVIVISEFAFTITETEVKDMLFNSGFGKFWKKNPNNYKLILLAYSEKDQEWQFGKDDTKEIESLEQHEVKKREKELNSVSDLLKMNPLPEDLEKSIITACILPVLHTSILAQQGEEYRIFQDYEQFLKNTGINKLINAIDGFVASRQKTTTEKVKAELSHFHKEKHLGNITAAAKSVLNVLNNREYKGTLEPTITKNNENILILFDKSLKQMLAEVVDTKVDAILKETAEEAKINWTNNKDKIKSFAVYNPYFYGKNPVYKVKLFNLFFDGLEDKKVNIFNEIKSRIEPLLKQCKDKTLQQLMEDLNKLLVEKYDPFTLEFVQNAIGNELDGALAWYLGNIQRPFNEKTMKKCFDKSQNENLKKTILKPNFKQESSLAIAKQKTEVNIEKCIMDIKISFLDKLFALHKMRCQQTMMNPNGYGDSCIHEEMARKEIESNYILSQLCRSY
ncbi:uncharacterized protein XB5964984.L isoform X2 [Xenopus laevis]|uniref:Uncharacterized protein XB5964984.L isoform X2 n=1 Tax=Xenopus laevis TaxID=8355 RepID=A0A8J1MRS6_XENLA|nr:uncharacterized protein XB5964984.L isoform X2 [Xenopus laevis]